MMRKLMLAQAQRCFYEKAALEGMSPKLLSKISAQVGAFYADVLSDLTRPPLGSHIHKTWANVVGWNAKLYDGLAQFHAAAEHADAYEYGVQVARLKYAVEQVAAAAQGSAKASVDPSLRQVYEKALAQVRAAAQQAEQDNSLIYNEVVPPFSRLAALAPRAIVKAQLPDAVAAPLAAADDPFIYLIPAAVQSQ
eukprot:1676185-Prymnesium_polylepis.1